MKSSKYMNKIRSFDVDQVDSLIGQLDTLNLNKYDNEVGSSFGFIPRLSSPFCSISWREKTRTSSSVYRWKRNIQFIRISQCFYMNSASIGSGSI